MLKDNIKEFIFEENSIAASCHASTVLPLEDGSVIAAWFAGEKEGSNDVRIWVAVRCDGKWEYPQAISSEENHPHWNPVLDRRNDGTICLYYKVGKNVPVWYTKYTISNDNGKTWSEPKVLVEGDISGGRGPVKDKCLRASNSALLAPASTEQNGDWCSFIDISYDDGITWERTENIERPFKLGTVVGMIQPTLWESPKGHIHALFRTNASKIYKSDSEDFGKTWCKAYATELPNNNSGIDCVQDGNGNIWLLYNPVGKNWGSRSPLTLAVSKDNGESWTNYIDLETQEGGEFSYPAITVLGENLHMVYTYNRKQIAYQRFTISNS